MSTAGFDDAIAWANAHETPWPRDPDDPRGGWGVHVNDPPPWNRLLGPVSARGPVSGVVWRAGEVLAQWGEPQRVDLTFSVAKTYLALLAGVAFDRGLLPDVHEPVIARVPGIGFEGAHNSAITWHHLLQQTSEWEGSVFGVADQADRYRAVQYRPAPAGGRKGDARPLQPPGTFWEYNDVRINQLSLALLHLFQRPLPEVFEQAIMAPVGASSNWRWVGYDNSWVEVAGRRVQSVPGGTHWGGGVSIDSFDQARVGALLLNEGSVAGRQVLSPEWIGRMRQPCAIAPFYGYLIWLNRDGAVFPSTPHDSYFAVGAGSSITWVDPQRQSVTVVRWIDGVHADGLFARVGAAIDRL
ncbi:MAG: serine hydrolase [Burkholderiaceae bacterium]|nr:serine hydrolase [Burkholderiaceae bacterium]